MRIGYPCITVGVPFANFRTCTEKYATEDHLTELIRHNLDALERVLTYNLSQGIQLFRIYSDLIPFGSSPVTAFPGLNCSQNDLIRSGRSFGMET